jgi:NADH-quinone oxidoreductase subunit G
MVRIFVEGTEHEVREGQNLLQAILGLGYDLPYFCWHPALGSVGACRQCAVTQYRNADDDTGMIVMACMTPVAEGLRISIDDPAAVAFRSSVIEWLMTIHPHDCPVCDEGGECHLQDMTVMTGHDRCRHRFAKRTHRNQDLGPFLNHEMNRCIQCYRCVRFYRDVAGGDDLNVFGSRNRVYFGRVEDGTLESPFSGNLAEICPTGVFTDKVFKSRTVRMWDLQTAPSVCVHCSLGCNTLPGERNGALRRIRNRYHGGINRYFLCDRGRFGFEFVNSPRRLRRPLIRDTSGGDLRPASVGEAVDRIAQMLAGGGAIGIGSPTASLEANHALRTVVGAENFFIGIDHDEAQHLETMLEILRGGPFRTPRLRDVERADAVLVLGEDPSNTAPLLDLAVRQAVLNKPRRRVRELGIPDWNDAVVRLVVDRKNGPLFIATPSATALDRLATKVVRGAPQDIARFGFAIAAAVDSRAPAPYGLSADLAGLAEGAAAALKEAEAPLIIAGAGAGEVATIRAAASIARALTAERPETALSLIAPSCNSVGAALLGAGDLTDAAAAAATDAVTTVIVLEPDLSRRGRLFTLTKVLGDVRHRVVLDQLEGPLGELADVVLPSATFAESGGTLVNNEGRAQRFFQVFIPTDAIRPSWRWLQLIGATLHLEATGGWTGSADVAASLAAAQPVFGPITGLTPSPDSRVKRRIPRQSHRVSGRTAVSAHRTIREPRPPDDLESPLAYSMEGSPLPPPPGLITRYWSPGWNSVQSLARFQEEIGGSLGGGDPGTRLFEPSLNGPKPTFEQPPEAFAPRDGEWLLVPLYHLFGSEPLSMETAGVAEQAPDPYVALNPEDAKTLGIEDGDSVEIEIDGHVGRVPLAITPDFPEGCAGFPEGLPAGWTIPSGRWARLRRPS